MLSLQWLPVLLGLSLPSSQCVRYGPQNLVVVRIMQSKSCRYGDERTLIVRSHMGERAVYYIGVSRARPNQALARATE